VAQRRKMRRRTKLGRGGGVGGGTVAACQGKRQWEKEAGAVASALNQFTDIEKKHRIGQESRPRTQCPPPSPLRHTLHLVFNDQDLEAVRFSQKVRNHRGLARAQPARNDSDGNRVASLGL
jgi:hypothetical protein